MDVCLLCLYVVLSCVGRGLCYGLITRPEESYRESNCVCLRNLNIEEVKAQRGMYSHRGKILFILCMQRIHLELLSIQKVTPNVRYSLCHSTKCWGLSFPLQGPQSVTHVPLRINNNCFPSIQSGRDHWTICVWSEHSTVEGRRYSRHICFRNHCSFPSWMFLFRNPKMSDVIAATVLNVRYQVNSCWCARAMSKCVFWMSWLNSMYTSNSVMFR
jgi:hypothetical protein